jgi:threonine-phosphate decarboxylase
MIQGAHGGNVYEAAKHLWCSVKDIYDYSSNVSPYPIKLDISSDVLSRLPEPHSETLVKKFAEKYGHNPENVAITSGTTEAIDIICRTSGFKKATVKHPTYSDYEYYCAQNEIEVRADICKKGLFFICNPNNPTGLSCPGEHLPSFFKSNPDTLFILDESYMPFMADEDKNTLLGHEIISNLIILRSFSKIYGLPGLRLGAVVALDKNIRVFNGVKSPWSVNTYAQEAGARLLDVDTKPIAERLLKMKADFLKEISDIEWLEPQESKVNFLMLKLKKGTSKALFEHCLQRRVLVRDCSNFNRLDGEYIRIAVADDMAPLVKALREF